mmetsp:Transcript_36322/g.88003  ORF Transcript_36322/g.88003 Transcript_36322/m.88003 type:complete len:326 (+) Transcript_36322:150-1127(+)
MYGQNSYSRELFRVLQHIEFNESEQTKGFVFCYYDLSTPHNPSLLPPFDVILKFMDFVTKVPVRRSGVHLCLKAEPGSLVFSSKVFETFVKGMRRNVRTRVRLHYGSDIELQYMLKSYGLNLESFPVDTAGNLRQDILNVWFHKYVPNHQWNTSIASASHMSSSVSGRDPVKQVGEGNDQALASSLDNNLSFAQSDVAHSSTQHNSSTHNGVTAPKNLIEPRPTDVVLGRGRGTLKHPGNVRFREFLREYQEEYNNTARYKRVKAPTELTRILLGEGIRFLKKTENGGWEESDFAEVEKKVKQLFRTRKKKKKKNDEMRQSVKYE